MKHTTRRQPGQLRRDAMRHDTSQLNSAVSVAPPFDISVECTAKLEIGFLCHYYQHQTNCHGVDIDRGEFYPCRSFGDDRLLRLTGAAVTCHVRHGQCGGVSAGTMTQFALVYLLNL